MLYFYQVIKLEDGVVVDEVEDLYERQSDALNHQFDLGPGWVVRNVPWWYIESIMEWVLVDTYGETLEKHTDRTYLTSLMATLVNPDAMPKDHIRSSPKIRKRKPPTKH